MTENMATERRTTDTRPGAAAEVVSCQALTKVYTQGPQDVRVLDKVSLQVHAGERIAVVGSSGSGKTTLLNMLGGLDLPTSGTVLVAGQDLSSVTEAERGRLRNRYLGFVYQFHHLLGEFSALENVCMPLLIAGESAKSASAKASSMLERVGLGERLQHKPPELSGGERQRVAIARALVGSPRCVLMDEPTGNLDRRTADGIHKLMQALNREFGISFIVVTHDERLAATMDRVLQLQNGQLEQEPSR